MKQDNMKNYVTIFSYVIQNETKEKILSRKLRRLDTHAQ